jgi:hypothetical protein
LCRKGTVLITIKNNKKSVSEENTMLKKIIIINMALAISLVLSTPLMAGYTDIGSGLIVKGNSGDNFLRGEVLKSEGWVHVGNGVIVGVRNGDTPDS